MARDEDYSWDSLVRAEQNAVPVKRWMGTEWAYNQDDLDKAFEAGKEICRQEAHAIGYASGYADGAAAERRKMARRSDEPAYGFVGFLCLLAVAVIAGILHYVGVW